MSTGLTARLTGEVRSPEEIQDAVDLFHGDIGAKQSRFWLLLVLSAVIATAGVLGDSTATVIGAMIVAPLATPIYGVGVGIANGEMRPLLQSALLTLGAALGVVLIAAGLALILPQLTPLSDNSQVTGRVAPTLIDLVAAAATGLAGAFAVARRDIGDILPGVAIAISLVPPLCVVGVVAVDGDWDGAFGALLLFLTNTLAMIVAAAALFAGLGVLRARHSRREFTPVYAVLGIAGILVVSALGAVTVRTVQLNNWRSAATDVGREWADKNGERLVLSRFDGAGLEMVVQGDNEGDPVADAKLPALLHGSVPDGTLVTISRIAGSRVEVGKVAAP
jgi:uncharacterized hydrophobic protein (TIGR00271 family)